MKLAASNIAWTPDEEDVAADVLRSVAIAAIEVAPTTVWPHPLEAEEVEVRAYADRWRQRGFEIVALQSLLYGRPDLQVFAPPSDRRLTLDYLDAICRVGSWLGGERLVFGSPKNRRSAHLTRSERDRVAIDFFREAGKRAHDHGTVLCLEHNPEEYSCDWLTSVEEAAAFVQAVDHPGIGLQLDAGGLVLGEADDESVARAIRRPGATHVHASEPFLAPLGSVAGSEETHRALARCLRREGYQGWVSLEMARRDGIDRRTELREVTALLCDWYGSPAR